MGQICMTSFMNAPLSGHFISERMSCDYRYPLDKSNQKLYTMTKTFVVKFVETFEQCLYKLTLRVLEYFFMLALLRSTSF